METNDYLILIWGMIAGFLWGQLEASGNIGNRSYSIWYQTHFLVEKRGICNLIYYQPKHFARYTLYEVISFFVSFLCVPIFVLFGIFRYVNGISSQTLFVMVALPLTFMFFCQFAIAIVNDIGSRKDEKKKFYLESGERNIAPPDDTSKIPSKDPLLLKVVKLGMEWRNQPYFTVHNLWDSYHARMKQARDDPEKQNPGNLDYIEYFKNMEHLVVMKENKNGSLQLKIKK